MRISDWSSDVCSSDLLAMLVRAHGARIDIDIGVELAQPHGIAASLQQRTERCRSQTFSEGGNHAAGDEDVPRQDRKSVVSGKSVSVRVDLGGRRIIKKKTTPETMQIRRSLIKQ